MKQINLILVFAIILAISFTGCEKYDEGGLIKKASEEIIGTWKLQQFLIDGTDNTSALTSTNYTEVYNPEGKFIISYNVSSGNTKSDDGKYTFDSDYNLTISDMHLEDFLGEDTDLIPTKFNILKLKDDEYWYNYTYGSQEYEFHLIRN